MVVIAISAVTIATIVVSAIAAGGPGRTGTVGTSHIVIGIVYSARVATSPTIITTTVASTSAVSQGQAVG